MQNLAAHILRSIDVLAETMDTVDGFTKLVPIHAVRASVVAGRDEFDRAMKEMRSNGLEIIAISDNRKATQEQLADAIEGINETLFWVVVD